MKPFLKEVVVVLLLILVIALTLGIVFYKYIPNTKVVPSEVEEYKTSDTVKDEIDQTTTDYASETQNVTFEITDSDLKSYKKSGSYITGKSNPFAAESSDTTSSGSDRNQNENSSSSSTSQSGNGSSNSNNGTTTNASSDNKSGLK